MLISYGAENYVTFAAVLLHDVLEDCRRKFCKKYYPEYANAFAILKSNIVSMNCSMNVMLSTIEAMENEDKLTVQEGDVERLVVVDAHENFHER